MKLRCIMMGMALGLLLIWTTSFAEEAKPSAQSSAAAMTENAGSVQVLKSVLCHDVKEREPQEEMTAIKVGDVVVGWMQVKSAEDSTVTHRWIREGQTISDVPLQIKTSGSYRAWSRKTIGSPGAWKWQILDANGKVLKEMTFNATS
jgi:hypothetical protein